MYRVVLPEGQIECERYEQTENGIECYLDGKFAAFVPYANCYAVVDEEVVKPDDTAVW
ncbi:hypothetical protein [Haloarchaeobius sp. HRN-SO-5]|uniref:hypothetical protein n=1 Tax=Haloarchaeobius sp. HRN-SO-5 TaxID=3446118 RepID=UPI003EC14934